MSVFGQRNQRVIRVVEVDSTTTSSSSELSDIVSEEVRKRKEAVESMASALAYSKSVYLPLEIYLYQNKVVLEAGKTLESETSKCYDFCWQKHIPVKKIQHPLLGVLPAFPTKILEELYPQKSN